MTYLRGDATNICQIDQYTFILSNKGIVFRYKTEVDQLNKDQQAREWPRKAPDFSYPRVPDKD